MNTPLPEVLEETDLVEFSEGSRAFKLHPDTLAVWRLLKNEARGDGVELELVSAFRSKQRQRQIIESKRRKGLCDVEIYTYSAPPGHSEHHSGRAIDLGTAGFRHLDEEFENSKAFAWMLGNGGRFGFSLSYPRDNKFGIAYEPWHWLHKRQTQPSASGSLEGI